MRKLARIVLLFSLAMVMAAPAMAADKKKKKKRKGRRTFSVVRLPKTVTKTLSAEQKTQIQAINREYAPKLLAVFKKMREIYTDDQKAVLAKVRKSGKKGKELRKAINEARKSIQSQLTSDQKKQQKDLRKQSRALRVEARKKALTVLTDEQKELYKKSSKRKGGKKRRKKKKAA